MNHFTSFVLILLISKFTSSSIHLADSELKIDKPVVWNRHNLISTADFKYRPICVNKLPTSRSTGMSSTWLGQPSRFHFLCSSGERTFRHLTVNNPPLRSATNVPVCSARTCHRLLWGKSMVWKLPVHYSSATEIFSSMPPTYPQTVSACGIKSVCS